MVTLDVPVPLPEDRALEPFVPLPPGRYAIDGTLVNL